MPSLLAIVERVQALYVPCSAQIETAMFTALPAAAALLELKRAATNAKFSSWVGSAPCGPQPWQYITCTQGRVVAL